MIDSREWKLWLERVSSYLASGLIVQRSLIAMIILLATVTCFLGLEFRVSHGPSALKMFRSARHIKFFSVAMPLSV